MLAEFWERKIPHCPEGSWWVVSEPVQGRGRMRRRLGIRKTADSHVLMVVDGLGHGILASDAAREAERSLPERRAIRLEILQDSHDALKKTRGAAVAVAEIRTRERVW